MIQKYCFYQFQFRSRPTPVIKVEFDEKSFFRLHIIGAGLIYLQQIDAATDIYEVLLWTTQARCLSDVHNG